MIKKILLLFTIGMEITMAQNIELAQKLYYNYEIYQEKSLQKKRFKYSDILPLIKSIQQQGIFTIKNLGKSDEGREIHMLSIGRGSSKILLWSQMHGDESTATMALFDVFNFFQTQDELSNLKNSILENATIYFVPMLNPDGAEAYQRRSSAEIDINRDFNRLQTPEGNILKDLVITLKPEFGFNLHDQSTRYSVGDSFKSAALAFLAPSLNHEKSVDSVRENSMKLIVDLANMLDNFIPGHIAKYNDDYEPRAFGDNIQKLGTSTVLIESGIWKNDRENQFIRKLNFMTLICAFNSIVKKSYKHNSIKKYELIPQNKERLFDLLLRNVSYQIGNRKIIIDIGINRDEVNSNKNSSYYFKSSVQDVGDLSVYYGFEELDLSGFTLELGKTYPKKFNSLNDLAEINFQEFYKKGYTCILVNKKPDSKFTYLPINIKTPDYKNDNSSNKLLGRSANFVIKKNGKIHYAVINGFLVNVKSKFGDVVNALVN